MKHRQQQRAKTKKIERVHSSFLTKVIILVLLAAMGFQLWHLSGQVSDAARQKEELESEVAQMEQENTALEEDIKEGPTLDKMKEIAEQEFGYVEPGTYLFDVKLPLEENP